MSRFAHFDAEEPLKDALCVSAFLVSMNDDGLLLGRMRSPKAWEPLDFVKAKGDAFRGDRWVLPAAHLKMGEHPDAAAKRIVSDQLQAVASSLKLWQVFSFVGALPERGQDFHWDLCFVYQADLELVKEPPCFTELQRVSPSGLSSDMFARGHGEVLEKLGVLSPS